MAYSLKLRVCLVLRVFDVLTTQTWKIDFSHFNKTLQVVFFLFCFLCFSHCDHADMTSADRRCAVLSSFPLSSFFSSLLPPFVLHFVLARCPAVYLSSLIQVSTWVFWEERQRKQRQRGGWMHCCINSGLLSVIITTETLPTSLSFFTIHSFYWPCNNNTCVWTPATQFGG